MRIGDPINSELALGHIVAWLSRRATAYFTAMIDQLPNLRGRIPGVAESGTILVERAEIRVASNLNYIKR